MLKRDIYLNGDGELGADYYLKPWLVLQKYIDKIPSGVSVFLLRAATTYAVLGCKFPSYSSFVATSYLENEVYSIYENDGKWHYAKINTGGYSTV
ncbi:MAG: hypothetical protein UDD43_08420 [Agathobacter sp.]|nr:hypothetical protein [Agathobacter sp.]